MTDIPDVPTVPPAPPTPPAPSPTPTPADNGRLWFKEIVTFLLAGAVFIALLCAYKHLRSLPDPARYSGVQDAAERARAMAEHQSHAETIATALFGIFAAFVGYYSGRIPAEKAASDANANAAQAQQTATNSQIQSNDLARKLDAEQMWAEGLLERVERDSRMRAESSGGETDLAALGEEIRRHLAHRRH